MTTCTFNEAIAMAKTTVGEVPPARLWNMLTARVRAGQDITDFTTMALVSSVVGKDRAAEFVGAVLKIWKR